MFNDDKGIDLATTWLHRWRSFAPDKAKWLIVLGEYGTGKTSLTKVLQQRWLEDYHTNPSYPIPVRIELRNFSRQFDATGLLHHFLDSNGRSHVPVGFMTHLIKTGRVVLLLDGYDEMAQFLNARERRACLNALAELASDGAKGILTSRPNYFTEHEELTVFEALYRKLDQGRLQLSQSDQSFIAKERDVDELIERYILDKYERSLQDLTPEQTRSLVKRKLKRDADGQRVVLAILDRVFRDELDGTRQALSGKPVIISYLLELVDDLKDSVESDKLESLTEWQVYKLIVDRLMLRDLQRTGMDPEQRRSALQQVALAISARDRVVADQSVFDRIIDIEFQRELRPLAPDERRGRRVELFEDLRSSATLTRAAQSKTDGWVFSHNSLREFLVTERLLTSLVQKQPIEVTVPISAAMRNFAAAISDESLGVIWRAFAEVWPLRISQHQLGPYLCLLWDAARRDADGVYGILRRLSGALEDDLSISLIGLNLKDISFSDEFSGATLEIYAKDAVFSDCSFEGVNLRGSNFDESLIDASSLRDCNLSDCSFRNAFIFEADFTGATVNDADFQSIASDSSIVLEQNGVLISKEGNEAVGYLRYHGAVTDKVDNYYVMINHPKYSIVTKIIEKVVEQKLSQYRGLTQRGGSRLDPPFARAFVDRLVSDGWLLHDKNDLISVTSKGRPEIQRMAAGKYMPSPVSAFLETHQ